MYDKIVFAAVALLGAMTIGAWGFICYMQPETIDYLTTWVFTPGETVGLAIVFTVFFWTFRKDIKNLFNNAQEG